MYLIAWRIFEENDKANKVTSIITILGIINVPIIKYSVDWWNTLHQPASINILSKSSIHISMFSFNDNDCGICPIFSTDFFNEI